MWWDVIAYIYWLFPKPAAKLRNIGHGSVIKLPKRILIERLNAFLQSNFNAIRQQVVLPQQILLLDTIV